MLMKSKKVWITVGTPASGKSSYIQQNALPNSIIISRDEIRKKLIGNGAYFSKEDEVFNTFKKTVYVSLLNKEIENIYIDATHISKGSRKKILSQLPIPKGTELNVLWFDVDLDICLERNKKRGGFAFVPPESIRRMKARFEAPTEGEFGKYGFEKVNIIKVGEN